MMNRFSLKDKVIVITGASGLLGRKHAEVVAEAKGIPVLLDLNEEVVKKQAAEIEARYNVRSAGYAVNITDEASLKKNCEDVVAVFGKIDGLVNNAANNPKMENLDEKNFSRLEYFPSSIWESDLAVGLKGSFLCIKYYGFEISKNPSGGSIVNISSDLGLIAPDQRLYAIKGLKEEQQPVKPVTYSVVKSGLLGLTRYTATYWADKGVRCNALCPGGVENSQDERFIREVCSRIPMGRMARADEYQGALLFLLSDASGYMNGAILSVDGGRTTW